MSHDAGVRDLGRRRLWGWLLLATMAAAGLMVLQVALGTGGDAPAADFAGRCVRIAGGTVEALPEGGGCAGDGAGRVVAVVSAPGDCPAEVTDDRFSLAADGAVLCVDRS